jgi:outer membrane protein OmpA-like peptidoglycan-associated protein
MQTATPLAQPVSTPSMHSVATLQPATKKPASFAFKLFMVGAALLVLVALAFGAGLVYLGYVAKKRVAAVQQAYKHDDVAGMINAAKGESDKPQPLAQMISAATGQGDAKPQPLPQWKAVSADALSSAMKIPVLKSLTWVEVANDPLRGDSESIYHLGSVTDQAIHISASQQFPQGDALDRFLGSSSSNAEQVRKIDCGRTVFRTDMENSAEADGYVCRQRTDEKRPGTVAVGFSKKTLNELRTTGHSEFTFHEDPLASLMKSFKDAITAPSGSSQDAANMDLMNKMMSFAPGNNQHIDTPPIKCTLHRQGDADVAIPVLVNDQPAELPAMHVVCKPPESDDEAHFYVLDDPDNPLILAAAGKTKEGGQVIKIYWDIAKRTGLEEELVENGRAKVYDLYFDFRSDELRPESNKVLKEIAEVMRAYPDWKLSVEGNTDNVGGDAYNLDLSKRRAAAVKEALVTQYGVATDRLSTTGFGSSHPIDTNDTIEGRSRNRRVELARQ